MRLQTTLISGWPPLAWLARCYKSSALITIFHGSRIEVAEDWFCEAVWAGDYEAGDFDRTEIIAGSGGRLRDDKVIFVSSGSTLDRLNSLEIEDGSWVSNSLPCLLRAVNADIDPTYPGYLRLIHSIVNGLKKYQRFVTTSVGPIQLTYFDNLMWDGNKLIVQSKPCRKRDFSTFARYREFLESSLWLLHKNLTSVERKYSYQLLSTASSGYDSATVTTLAKEAGCKQVLCFDRARDGDEDSGGALVKSLGLTAISAQRSAWRHFDLPEVPFIAANGEGEDIFFKVVEHLLAEKVLLTGFYGDKIWTKDSRDLTGDVQGDTSGLSLTEYRLMVGFIHCPVPFWGWRQIKDVNVISNSLEMRPWDVPGDYSRPICRRIIEEAGVPRELFGVKKRVAAEPFNTSEGFLSLQSTESYLSWLRTNRNEWIRRGRIPPLLNLRIEKLLWSGSRHIRDYINHTRGLWRLNRWLKWQPVYLRRFMFPWALEHAKKIYQWPFEIK